MRFQSLSFTIYAYSIGYKVTPYTFVDINDNDNNYLSNRPSTDMTAVQSQRDDSAEWVVQFSIDLDTLPEDMSKPQWEEIEEVKEMGEDEVRAAVEGSIEQSQGRCLWGSVITLQ